MSEEQEKGRNGDWNEHWNLDCHSDKLKVSFAFEFGALEPVVQTCDNRYTIGQRPDTSDDCQAAPIDR